MHPPFNGGDEGIARDWNRTSTSIRTQAPQACASANSATRALRLGIEATEYRAEKSNPGSLDVNTAGDQAANKVGATLWLGGAKLGPNRGLPGDIPDPARAQRP